MANVFPFSLFLRLIIYSPSNFFQALDMLTNKETYQFHKLAFLILGARDTKSSFRRHTSKEGTASQRQLPK